jgi:calcineurin-like phosphoesterase family protein
MIFFTSDEHYHHKAMIGHCDRPFKDFNVMNNKLIENHNSVVGEKDTVYHLGDFVFPLHNNTNKVSSILDKLNGKHHLILGNHDELKPFSYVNAGFLSVHTALEMDELAMWLSHDPSIFCVMPSYYWLLCGHVHTLFHVHNRCINVGVDVNNYTPISLTEIQKIITEKEEEHSDN